MGRKANRKSQKSPLQEMAENLPVVSSPLKEGGSVLLSKVLHSGLLNTCSVIRGCGGGRGRGGGGGY